MIVSVIIPTLFKESCRPNGAKRLFLRDAVESIWNQKIRGVTIQIVVGCDAEPSDYTAVPPDVQVVASGKKSLPAALNAAAKIITGDIVAFVEDDDLWEPQYLQTAFAALENAAFVSSTQLEVYPDGKVRRINDFPTPSGWAMWRKTWDAVGPFDEGYPVHQDNEWLGRLSTKPLDRYHMVESTAPVDPQLADQVRPWLAMVHKYGGQRVRYFRHEWPIPLVQRLITPGSWMGRIAQVKGPEYEISQKMIGRLVQEYGRMPW